MGGSTDVVRLGERDTRDGGGQARIEDESGVHFVPGYASLTYALQFVYAVFVLMAAPNRKT